MGGGELDTYTGPGEFRRDVEGVVRQLVCGAGAWGGAGGEVVGGSAAGGDFGRVSSAERAGAAFLRICGDEESLAVLALEEREDGREGIFGEELLPAEDDDEEPEAVSEARDESLPQFV